MHLHIVLVHAQLTQPAYLFVVRVFAISVGGKDPLTITAVFAVTTVAVPAGPEPAIQGDAPSAVGRHPCR